MSRLRALLVGDDSPASQALSEAASTLGAEIVRAAAGALACVLVDLDAVGRAAGEAAVAEHAARGVPVFVAGSHLRPRDVHVLFGLGARDVAEAPLHKRDLILRLSAVLSGKRRIACVGGGTGLFNVLSGLRDAPRTLLTSVVTMSDDGGSSGKLRSSFGVLPPGDVRRSLVALANAPEVMSFVMQYRFGRGEDLRGHSLGNLLLTALSELTGSMQGAVKALGDVLNVQGLVMGVTEGSTTLCAALADGTVVRGESNIDRGDARTAETRIRRVFHEPPAETTPDVTAALLAADLVVLGPGDLYTSILPCLAIEGVADAIARGPSRRVYVCNLMTKPSETEGYDALDHVRAVVEALGEDALDEVIVSDTVLDLAAVEAYAREGQRRVIAPAPEAFAAVTRARVLARDVGDRSELVRHDGARLRDVLLELCE